MMMPCDRLTTRKICALIKAIVLAGSSCLWHAAVYATPPTNAQEINLSYYDSSMGRWSHRDTIPRPLAFSDTRKAHNYTGASYLTEKYQFFNERAVLNFGGSLAHAKKKIDPDRVDLASFNVTIFSVVPELRLYLRPTKPALNVYMNWSIGGLSYLLGPKDDGAQKVHQWQFQDYLGVGLVMGHWNLNAKLVHFSGCKILHQDKGFDVPWTIGLGYSP